ncbi:MAG: isopentenyl-diphosphate Delta-isomerase [Candidatus Cyclobacteriaceae bacterium M2_1C_046]
MEQVILVDSRDREVGVMEKMKVHQEGLLHRAFSVIIFNKNGEMLLQKRASQKYHSAGLWSNTCCSHPKPEERTEAAVKRRLKEEMGINTKLSFLYSFIYKYNFENQLIEHELDHVYIGLYDNNPILNPDEAEDFKWITWQDLLTDIAANSQAYSFWFRQIIAFLDRHSFELPETLRPKL